jgi:hypothetical protein
MSGAKMVQGWCKDGATVETRITEARKTDGAEGGAMVQL